MVLFNLLLSHNFSMRLINLAGLIMKMAELINHFLFYLY